MVTEETVICLHEEAIDSASHIGTCKICGQQRYYDPEEKGETRLIKRGRINGIFTEVRPPSRTEALQKLEALSKPSITEPAVVKEEKATAESTHPVAEEHPAPPKPKKRKLIAAYYEANKDAIIADYRSKRLMDFFKKWHLTSNTWLKLKLVWEVTPNSQDMSAHRHQVHRPGQRARDETGGGDSPPTLPPFNNDWNFLTQIEWLQTYKELKLADKL